MSLNIRTVLETHYVCQDEPSFRLCRPANTFWQKYLDGDCHEAQVATQNGILVGFLRYDISSDALYARGTWVHPDYRKAGIATQMWERMIQLHKPESVYVEAVTPEGEGFIQALKDRWPKIICFSA